MPVLRILLLCSLPPTVRQQLLARARELGFDTSRLIRVGQQRPDA